MARYMWSSILDVVVASAVEAEYGTLFLNGQIDANIIHKLIAMGHSQPGSHLSSQTTNVRVVLQTRLLSRANRSRWTCAITGFEIG